MNIETPAALALALGLPAILALWLLRPRRPRLRTSSLLLWRGAEVQRHSARPWQRLRNHPLLWLQLLVAALLVAAAVRPFLPATAGSQTVVVLLDASASMRATDVSPDRFAAARGRTLDLARSLGPGQRLTLIRLDESPRVLVADADADAVERALASQQGGYGTADLRAALNLAEGIAPGASEWILVTDAAFEVPPGARLPPGVTLRTVVVAPPEPGGNVAVSGVRVRVEGDRASVQAGVHNTGGEAVSGSLVLLAEDTVVGAQNWTLEPGEERFLSWSGLPREATWFEARLADVPMASNALAHDDSGWSGVPARVERRVLLATDGNTFLERVLAVLEGIRADRVAPDGWQAVVESGEPYDVLVLDGLWPEEPPPGNVLVVGGPPAADVFRPERIVPAAGHPLLRHVDWSDVSIAEARVLPLDDSWEVVVDSPQGPLLAVRESGARREAAFAFDLSQTDLALRPAFPVLMANLLEWLAPRGDREPLRASPGEPVRVEPAPLAEQVEAASASGTPVALAPPWPPAPFRPPEPGLYVVTQAGQGVAEEQLLLVDGYQRSEAVLAPRPVSIKGVEAGPASSLPATARALWPWFAVALVAVSLVEWWLDARGR